MHAEGGLTQLTGALIAVLARLEVAIELLHVAVVARRGPLGGSLLGARQSLFSSRQALFAARCSLARAESARGVARLLALLVARDFLPAVGGVLLPTVVRVAIDV